MSLHGLDDAPVSEAYQAAQAEAGGWFLLKYASRDAVDIYNFGTGAVSEARAAIVQYDEKSPLYGLLHYRRRKVLLKYIPDGTSRLLQARVTVHFTEIEEKFAPHDSVFSFTSPQELSDNALAAASSLHTAAPSSVSSTSSKQKLDGINEDAEEAQGASGPTEGAALERTETGASVATADAVNGEGPASPRSFSRAESEDQRPPTPCTSTLDSAAGSPKGYAQSVRSFKSLNNRHDYLHQDDATRRSSSQTARPPGSEAPDFSYLYKPKVKLGPRPMDSPNAAGDAGKKSAKVPASLKASMRKAASSRPKSRESSTVPSIGVPPPPPVPNILEMPVTTTSRPTSSPGLQSSGNSVKSPGITPEKQRLMKALELRKKQMKAAQMARAKEESGEEAAIAVSDEVLDATAGADAKQPSSLDEDATAAAEDENSPLRETSSSTESGSTIKAEAPATPDHTKADSGVQWMISGAGDEEDARPPTPVASSPTSIQESSNPSSTRPSSISEGGERKDLLHSEDRAEPLASDAETEVSLGVPSDDDPPSSRVSDAETPKADVSSAPDRGSTGAHQTTAVKEPSPIEDITTTLPTISCHPKRRSTQKDKRRASADPIRVDPNAELSDADYLSDDSFMEELQSATVEEAKPMSVSKSPIMPIFPRRKSNISSMSSEQRVNSNPLSMYSTNSQARLTPEDPPSQRSLSASYAGASEKIPLAKKTNVSSGISQRIKALAEKQNRDSAAAVPMRNGFAADSLIAQRTSSFRVPPSESRPVSRNHNKRLSRSSFISVAPIERPTSRGDNSNENFQTAYNKSVQSKPESVTVTARIIRTPQTPKNELEASPLDLQASPLIVDHNKANRGPSSVQLSPTRELSPTKECFEESGPASPPQPPLSESPQQAAPRTSSESSWRSFGRRRSEAVSPPPMPRSQSVTSIDSTATDEGKEDKKGSRTSRLLKRVSNSLSVASRKGLNQMVSPTVQEEMTEEIPVQKEGSKTGMEIGDLNVQFPDTLLWKRRWVEIDGQGYIVLSLSRSNEQSKGITKRYHLSEFQAPFAPDQERQEMPNSVIFDFHDGRTLQCACEDTAGQVHILELLRNAHQAWVAK